jgi:UDP-glucose 4-epimerase
MTAVLVTGSAGFLGRRICALLLERGTTVIGVDPLESGAAAYQSFADDLSDRRRIAEYLTFYNITHIIHCGGISSPRLATPERIVAINCGGSLNLALAACVANVQRFVFASSIAAATPSNTYGLSKAATEFALRSLDMQGSTRFASLRFAGIYGPGRVSRILPHDLAAAALEGTAISVPAQPAQAYIYIADAAAAATNACFSREVRPEPYVIAHPQRITALDFAAIVQKLIPSFRFDITESNDTAATSGSSADVGVASTYPTTDYISGMSQLIEWMSSTGTRANKL